MNVSETYKSLFHYTTLNGLEGILSSQSLWATYYKFLSDSQEIVHAKALLRNLLLPRMREVIEKGQKNDPELYKLTQQHGGVDALSIKEADGFIDILYKALLGKPNDEMQYQSGPYLVSFCASDDPFVNRNGLLSQWRGYGKDGGYTIEFDASQLERLFSKERDKFYYPIALFGDVGYGNDRDHLPGDFQQDLENMEKWFGDFIDVLKKGEVAQREIPPNGFDAFVRLISRSKHEGFKEEKEVRILFFPGTEELRNQESVLLQSREIKLIYYEKRAGTLVPYICVFRDLGELLPIKRIIVGPHRDKELRAESLRMKLKTMGINADVTCSAIPFLGLRA